MKCPVCSTELKAEKKELEETDNTITIMLCPKKHGGWLSSEDLGRLDEELDELGDGPGFFTGLFLGIAI